MKCPLCGFEFDPVTLDCRETGCPLAQVQGCSIICCPNCGYQMPDKRDSVLAGLIERLQAHFTRRGAAAEAHPGQLSVRDLKPGQSAVVTELAFSDADRLDQLCAFGLAPGCTVQLDQTEPVVILRIGGTTLSLDSQIAGGIVVSREEPAAPAAETPA